MLKKIRLLPVLLLLSQPALAALSLMDNAGFTYDIGSNGMLESGTRGAYARMYGLRINGTDYRGQISRASEDGRTVYLDTYIDPMTGVEVRRRVYVPIRQNFIRYLESISNPTDVPQKVTVEIFGTLGAEPQVLFDQNYYLITDNRSEREPDTVPVLLHYHSQLGNPLRATHSVDGTSVSWQYPEVEVPPFSKVRFIHFAAQTHSFEHARQLALLIFGNESLLYDDLGTTVLGELVNFAPVVPIPEGNFSKAPFVSVGDTRRGTLTKTDAFAHARSSMTADAYGLRLDAEQAVTLQLAADFDAMLYLFQDVAGSEVLAFNNDADPGTTNAELRFTAPASGLYYLEVTAYRSGDDIGNYTLRVLPGAANRPPQPVSLDFAGGDLTAPATVVFTDFSLDPDGLISEYCWDFGDNSGTACTGTNRTSHIFANPGYYTVGVRLTDNRNATAHHSVRLAVRDTSQAVILPVNSGTGGELVTGDAYSRSRPLSFADRYTITSATPGQTLIVTMTSAEFDGYLYLYDAFGRRLREDDNSAGGTNPRLVYVPQTTGDLLLEATSVDSKAFGNYNLDVRLTTATVDQVVSVPLEMFPGGADPLQAFFMLRLPENLDVAFLRWNFGDGTPEIFTDGATASHSYRFPATYGVRVYGTLRDGSSIDKNGTFTLTTRNAGLNAKFRASPVFGDAPLKVFFNNESRGNLSNDTLRYHWDFGDGRESTDADPNHFYRTAGTYNVVLTVTSTLTRQRTATAGEIIVIDRAAPPVPVTGTARVRPQVVMAGFDPILVDMADTRLTVFALVRPGNKPLQSVLVRYGSDFITAMHHAATYQDGIQRYEAVITFPAGTFPANVFGDLFGTGSEDFNIQAVDQDNQYHDFPALEFGNYTSITTPAVSNPIAPPTAPGIRRKQPQVLAAGFGSPIMDVTESGVEIIALVREGLFPLHSVQVKQNQSDLVLSMQREKTLPNGDQWYRAVLTYPHDTVTRALTLDLFGTGSGELVVKAVDYAGRSHRFPELRIGNYPRR